MAYVSFSNARVLLTFTSPHSMNAWAYIETQPWRKVQPISTDGVNNMFTLLNAAKAGGRTVSGSYDDSTGLLYTLYMN
jgi:immune inhibitor A